MGQKYAQCDSSGKIIAYYDDDINPADQIGDAVKITHEQWKDSISNPGKYVIASGNLKTAKK